MLKRVQMRRKGLLVQGQCVSVKLRHVASVAYTGSLEAAVRPDFAASAIQATDPIISIPGVPIVVELGVVRNPYPGLAYRDGSRPHTTFRTRGSPS